MHLIMAAYDYVYGSARCSGGPAMDDGPCHGTGREANCKGLGCTVWRTWCIGVDGCGSRR